MARISKAEKERIRQAIVDQSRRLFDQRGYENTSIKAIAEAVGIANGTVFNYFECKEEIYLVSKIESIRETLPDDFIVKKEGNLQECLMNMIEGDVKRSLSVEKEVFREIIFVSLKMSKLKKVSFSDLVYLDRSYINKIAFVLKLYNFEEWKMVSEIIYNTIVSESLMYLYVDEVMKEDLLKSISEKTMVIIDKFNG